MKLLIPGLFLNFIHLAWTYWKLSIYTFELCKIKSLQGKVFQIRFLKCFPILAHIWPRMSTPWSRIEIHFPKNNSLLNTGFWHKTGGKVGKGWTLLIILHRANPIRDAFPVTNDLVTTRGHPLPSKPTIPHIRQGPLPKHSGSKKLWMCINIFFRIFFTIFL